MTGAGETGWSLPPRAILVAGDLTLAAANATWRAAELAREHGSTLRLLQVAADARQMQGMPSAPERLADAIQHRLGVAAEVVTAGGGLTREAGRAALDADLLVVPARDGTTWRERMAGTTTERLVRASRIPVLVVKRPLPRARATDSYGHDIAGYARVLACAGASSTSTSVIAAAAGLGAKAHVEVFHALSLERRRSDRLPGALHAGAASTIVSRKRAELEEWLVKAGASHAVPGVGFGPAASSVLARERATGADLLVIGKRHSRLLADFCLSALAQEVMSNSRCDVLLVPTPSSSRS